MVLSKSINIEMQLDSPKIVLDVEKSIFLIEGPSYPEDANEVYDGVLNWIKQNVAIFNEGLSCKFKFKVLSSASRKMIFEIFLTLEKFSQENGNIEIHWFYEKYDEDMMEVGEDFAEIVDIPFKFFPE